jgi:hypothetical protein
MEKEFNKIINQVYSKKEKFIYEELDTKQDPKPQLKAIFNKVYYNSFYTVVKLYKKHKTTKDNYLTLSKVFSFNTNNQNKTADDFKDQEKFNANTKFAHHMKENVNIVTKNILIDYILDLLAHIHYYNIITVTVYDASTNKYFKNVKTNTTIHPINNCLLQILYDDTKAKLNNQKDAKSRNSMRLRARLLDIENYDKVATNLDGLDKDLFDEISKKLKVNIVARDQLNNIWHESISDIKSKTYDVLIHDNHAINATDMLTFSISHPITTADINNQIKNETETPIQILRKGNDIQAYRTKSKQVRQLFPEHQNDHLTEENLDEIYKNIIDLYPKSDKPQIKKQFKSTYELTKLADFNQKNFSYNYNENTPIYGMDRNGSYLAYKSSPYFNTYQFPNPPNNFTTDKTYLNLDKSGFSVIDNVNILNPTIKLIQRFQNKCIYPNPVLKFAQDNNLMTFDIVASLFAEGNQDPLPDPTEYYPSKKDELRQLYGKLIQHDQETELQLLTKDETEYTHIMFMLMNNQEYTLKDADPNTLTINIKKLNNNPSKKQLHYIHSYILAYHDIAIMSKLMTINPYNLVALVCDAIYTNIPIPFEHSSVLGGWKPSHLKKLPPNIKDLDLSQSQVDISKAQTKYIKNRINRIGGPGSGKSYLFTTVNMFDPLIVTQSRNLQKKWKKLGFYATTSHKYTNTNTTKQYKFHNANIIYDDCGIETKDIWEKVVTKAIQDGSNIYLTSDYLQLKPITGDFFTTSDLYKLFTEEIQEYTPTKHRFTENQLARIQQTRQLIINYPKFEYCWDVDIEPHVQMMHHYKPLTKSILELYNDRVIDQLDLNITDNDIVLSPTHKRMDKLKKHNITSKTFHTFQGESIETEKVYIDATCLDSLSFDPSLLYVGLSRAHSAEQIIIIK